MGARLRAEFSFPVCLPQSWHFLTLEAVLHTQEDGEAGDDLLQDWEVGEGVAEEPYWAQHREGLPNLLDEGSLEGLTYEELCKVGHLQALL
jgi:hypothetical protein